VKKRARAAQARPQLAEAKGQHSAIGAAVKAILGGSGGPAGPVNRAERRALQKEERKKRSA
jgi:hypothetical protein